MAFMELFTEYDVWYTVETEGGESFLIPESVCGSLLPDRWHWTNGAPISEDTISEHYVKMFADNAEEFKGIDPLNSAKYKWDYINAALSGYTNGRGVVEVSAESGWCARYSAPGYLDCTEWCGPFATEEEAEEECRAMYGDDEEDADENE